jgi:four helix bundle protein
MSRLPYVRTFRDLIVYQKSRALAKRIFEVTQTFPREERYALTDQVRRSSRSVGAQIAEAWAKRRYERHFISKLTDADGEQQETQHWIEVAFDSGYLTEKMKDDLIADCLEIGRLLAGMIAKSDRFCGVIEPNLREPGPAYHTSSDIDEFFLPTDY